MGVFDDMSGPAFLPFFSDRIIIRGVRPDSRTIELALDACVFPGGSDEPFGEDSLDSSISVFSVVFPATAWRENSKPQIGDSLEYQGSRLRVSAANLVNGDWHLAVRESNQ